MTSPRPSSNSLDLGYFPSSILLFALHLGGSYERTQNRSEENSVFRGIASLLSCKYTEFNFRTKRSKALLGVIHTLELP